MLLVYILQSLAESEKKRPWLMTICHEFFDGVNLFRFPVLEIRKELPDRNEVRVFTYSIFNNP